MVRRKSTQHDTSEYATRHVKRCWASHAKSRCRCKTNFDTLSNMLDHVGMSRSATPATRNEFTRGTAIGPSRERLRTVVNGCPILTSGEHTLNPQTPRVKQGPLLRIREEVKRCRIFHLRRVHSRSPDVLCVANCVTFNLQPSFCLITKVDVFLLQAKTFSPKSPKSMLFAVATRD